MSFHLYALAHWWAFFTYLFPPLLPESKLTQVHFALLKNTPRQAVRCKYMRDHQAILLLCSTKTHPKCKSWNSYKCKFFLKKGTLRYAHSQYCEWGTREGVEGKHSFLVEYESFFSRNWHLHYAVTYITLEIQTVGRKEKKTSENKLRFGLRDWSNKLSWPGEGTWIVTGLRCQLSMIVTNNLREF